MRRPSTRAEIYARWSRRCEAPRLPISVDDPEPGFYWRRFVRGGPRVPVEIRLLQEIDPENGELANDERLVAIVGTERAFETFKSRWGVERQWLAAARNPISREEFLALVEIAPASWMAKHNPLMEFLK